MKDNTGTTVLLKTPAQRIVSLAPHITESLFAIGAGNRIVGTVSYSDYPQEALKIPVIGGYNRINPETVVALQPDLVIAWREGNSPETIDHLRALGLTVFVTDPRRLNDIPNTLRDFSELTGMIKTGYLAAQKFADGLQALHLEYEDKTPVSLFYQVWASPLMTINGDNLIADVITLCGGKNVFAHAIPTHPLVSTESVLHADPQLIIASGMGEERPDWLDAWREWPLRAARNHHLYFIPPSLLQRHSTRILNGAETMCAYIDGVRNFYARQVLPK
ncbi:MAG: cobalamin-binding protein [Porticoccaceae bacterium]|nr:cobalamin-binding protein [Porticoccaceae bacterium]